MANTPYQTRDQLLSALDLVAVPTDAAATTSYGYTQAQADAIVAQLNAVIALLKAGGFVAAV